MGGAPIATSGSRIGESDLSNLPSAATGREKRNGWSEDTVLAGADVSNEFCSFLPLLVAAEGVFATVVKQFSPGVSVSVVVWRFW